jgi:hypothetical protein
MPVSDAVALKLLRASDIAAGAVLTLAVAIALTIPSIISPSGALDDRTLAAILMPDRWFAMTARLLILLNVPPDAGWLEGARLAAAMSAVTMTCACACACGLLSGSASIGALLSGTTMMTLPMTRIFASANLDAPATAFATLALLAAFIALRRTGLIMPVAAGIFGLCAALLDPAYLAFPFLLPVTLIATGSIGRTVPLFVGVLVLCAILSFAAVWAFGRPPHPAPVMGIALFSYGGLGLVIAVLGIAGLRIRPSTRLSVGLLGVIGIAAIAAIASGGIALAEIALTLGAAAVAGADRKGASNLPVIAIGLGGFLTGGPLLYGLLAGLPLLFSPGKHAGIFPHRQAVALSGAPFFIQPQR